MDTVLPEKDLHVSNTIPRSNGRLEFWLMQPRPTGVSLEEWEAFTQARWDRAFGSKGESCTK